MLFKLFLFCSTVWNWRKECLPSFFLYIIFVFFWVGVGVGGELHSAVFNGYSWFCTWDYIRYWGLNLNWLCAWHSLYSSRPVLCAFLNREYVESEKKDYLAMNLHSFPWPRPGAGTRNGYESFFRQPRSTKNSWLINKMIITFVLSTVILLSLSILFS